MALTGFYHLAILLKDVTETFANRDEAGRFIPKGPLCWREKGQIDDGEGASQGKNKIFPKIVNQKSFGASII